MLLRILFSISVFFSLNNSFCQNDSIAIRQFFDEALLRGKSYEDLRSLCKGIGARLSGSAQAQMAVEWGKRKMETYGFDKIYLQPVMVPHWERGNKEVAWIQIGNSEVIPVDILALGGSIGTNGTLKAEVIEFKSLDDLKKATHESC